MAAIDDLKAERDEVAAKLQQARGDKQGMIAYHDETEAQYAEQLSDVNARIDLLVLRKDRLSQAIRDLTDNWTPAP